MVNNIITISIALVFITTMSVPLFRVLKSRFARVKKIRIQGKSGETAELDLERKNDVNAVIDFADILLGLK